MTAPTGKTVIGCVHGAWWQLRDAMGDDAPTYDWCEQQWTSGLSKQVTVGAKDLPQRLTALMRARWATERTNRRWAEHYYRCWTCGRWFGADYTDPVTGETLGAHEHGGKQLALFTEAVS